MENKLLSQSDIDSLVSDLSAQSPSPPPPAKKGDDTPLPAPASVEKPAAPPDIPTKYALKKASLRHPERAEDAECDSEAIATLTAQNTKLQERITKLEVKIQKLEQMEKIRSGIVAHVTPQDVQGLNEKVEQLTTMLNGMNLKLQSTLGYDIFHLFTCEKCGAKENVSSIYKCTSCGHETWLGWKTRGR